MYKQKMLNDLRVSEQCFRQIKESLQFLGCLTSLTLTITVDSRLLEITYGSKRVKMALHSKRISNHFLRQWTMQQLWYLNIGHIDQICVLLVEYRPEVEIGKNSVFLVSNEVLRLVYIYRIR